ncbi:MAG: hypothetical protein LAT79_12210 [Kiritimatiellae bacterium]|nr:hypothetical protein [Kiritimatiellia bacterium]
MKLKRLFILMSMFTPWAHAEWVTVFAPDFTREYEGNRPNQFNFVGSAMGCEFVAHTGVQNGRFRMVTAHMPGRDTNHSITRLSRHGNASPNRALDLGRGAAMIRLEFGWRPNHWAAVERNVLDVQIGEAFRRGPYHPARGGNRRDGPSFAGIQLEAAAVKNQFRLFLSGSGRGSELFEPEIDGEGVFRVRLSLAYNNTREAVEVTAPAGGGYTLKPRSVAAWRDGELILDNLTDPGAILDAEFQHVSFGFGNGTDRGFEEAEAYGGIYEIGEISVMKWVP